MKKVKTGNFPLEDDSLEEEKPKNSITKRLLAVEN